MSYRKLAFARPLLPKCCESRGKAEPKRNIISVFENDFGSKIQQAVIATPPRGFTAKPVPDARVSLRLLQFDMVVEPLSRFCEGTYVMRFAFGNANHGDN